MRFLLLFTLTLSSYLMALPPGLHTAESKVPDFELPVLFPEGTSAAEWNDDLRAETLTLFEKEMFGKVPAISRKASAKLGKKVPDFLNRKAVL